MPPPPKPPSCTDPSHAQHLWPRSSAEIEVLPCERQCQYCPTATKRAHIWPKAGDLRRHVRDVHEHFRAEHGLTMPKKKKVVDRNGVAELVRGKLEVEGKKGWQWMFDAPEIQSLPVKGVSRKEWRYWDPELESEEPEEGQYRLQPVHVMAAGPLGGGSEHVEGGSEEDEGGMWPESLEFVYAGEGVPTGFCHIFRKDAREEAEGEEK